MTAYNRETMVHDALAAQLGYRPRAWGWLGDGGHDRAGGLVSPTGVGVARQTRRVTDETGYLRVRTL